MNSLYDLYHNGQRRDPFYLYPRLLKLPVDYRLIQTVEAECWQHAHDKLTMSDLYAREMGLP